MALLRKNMDCPQEQLETEMGVIQEVTKKLEQLEKKEKSKGRRFVIISG